METSVIFRGQGYLECFNSKPLEVIRRREVRLQVSGLLNEGPEKGMGLSLCLGHIEMSEEVGKRKLRPGNNEEKGKGDVGYL